jgi:hypothetical protein
MWYLKKKTTQKNKNKLDKNKTPKPTPNQQSHNNAHSPGARALTSPLG